MGKGSGSGNPEVIATATGKGETRQEALAQTMIAPHLRHAVLGRAYASNMLGDSSTETPIMTVAKEYGAQAKAAAGGDLTMASHMLMSQALSLDTIFVELARRASLNLGQYPDAVERYTRLALKAQGNCRATLEALAKLHQPREQTVRHVHVNEGGQAIVADQFHHHAGGAVNVEPCDQSHGAGPAGRGAALPRPNPSRDAMPFPGGEGAAAMPDARRDESGRP